MSALVAMLAWVASPVTVAMLMAQLDPARQATLAAVANLASVLDAHYAAGTTAWPSITVTRERYIEELARRITMRGSEAADRVLLTMPGADLYLVVACADNDATALAAFRDAFVPGLRQA